MLKKGARGEITIYRPISIMNTCAKVFEIVLKPMFTKHIYPIISTKQHGFIPKRSTSTNLNLFTQDLSLNINERQQTDAI